MLFIQDVLKEIRFKKEWRSSIYDPKMTAIKPVATKYISPKTYKTLDGIEIVKNQLLMSKGREQS